MGWKEKKQKPMVHHIDIMLTFLYVACLNWFEYKIQVQFFDGKYALSKFPRKHILHSGWSSWSSVGICSPSFDVSPSVTIYTATTCCLESAILRCSTDPCCTQAYKHGRGSQRCPPYRQEPKVPPVEMSLFPLGCHTMSATLWSQLKALQVRAFAHSTHSKAKALTLARSY